jgi:hypothetical protein
VTFKSGAVLENLRGATLHGCVIDEVRDQPSHLWSRIIQPMITTTGGWVLFISTPNGFDTFYDLYSKGETRMEPGWASFHASSIVNPGFSKEEFQRLEREMSEAEFAQEILAQFRVLTAGKVYVNHGEWNWKSTSPFTRDGSRISPHLPILVGADFNLSPMSWHLGQHNTGTSWYFDRIWLKNSHTQEAAGELVRKVRGHKPGVVLIGDATAKAGQRAAAGKSDYSIIEQILTEENIRFENRTPESNPTVKDRVNTVNTRMKARDGTVKLLYDPVTCPEFKIDCDRVYWKEGTSGLAVIDKSNPLLTHASDSVGYPECGLSTLWTQSPGVLGVILR